jgi:hypothetical protein
MHKGFPLFAVLLILIGALMLLDRSHVVEFGWTMVLWTLLAVLGGYKLVSGFRPSGGGSIFWGTVFLAVGCYGVLGELELFALPGGTLFPSLLIVMGIGALLMVLRRPREWHVAVLALLLLLCGAAMLLAEGGYLTRPMVLDLLKQWWPVALIVFGAALLLNGRERERETPS